MLGNAVPKDPPTDSGEDGKTGDDAGSEASSGPPTPVAEEPPTPPLDSSLSETDLSTSLASEPSTPTRLQMDVEKEAVYADHVRLGEDGWRERYYAKKFEVDYSNRKEVNKYEATASEYVGCDGLFYGSN